MQKTFFNKKNLPLAEVNNAGLTVGFITDGGVAVSAAAAAKSETQTISCILP